MKSTDMIHYPPNAFINQNSHVILANEKIIREYLILKDVEKFINIKELRYSANYLIDKSINPNPKNSALTSNLIRRGVSPEFMFQNQ
jgi:hypothetical protein